MDKPADAFIFENPSVLDACQGRGHCGPEFSRAKSRGRVFLPRRSFLSPDMHRTIRGIFSREERTPSPCDRHAS